MKIYTLGTSITAGGDIAYEKYPDLLARELGATVVNLGTSGGTLGNALHGGVHGAILNAADKVGSDADAIVVECIMNDFRVCTPLGQMFDTTADTYYGALSLLIDKLKSKAPNARIFFTNSHENGDTSSNGGHETGNTQRANHLGLWIYDYQTAVESMASFNNNASMINTFFESGIRADGESQYQAKLTYDKLHLTNEGARAYAGVVSDAIRRELVTPKKLLRKVVYVPIDDRPCNYDRVKLAGDAMGLELIMPPKALVATKLDSQVYEGDQSNVGLADTLLGWLNSYYLDHGSEIDAYLLSLDMLYSGGLVGSRDSRFDSYTDADLLERILDFINSVDKPIYLMDTVMRLAATASFNGHEMSVYNATRAYGMKTRKVASAFSVQAVVDCMRYDRNGNVISHPGLTTTQVNNYLKNRERKIRFASKIIQTVKNKTNVYLIYGVDDSSNQDNIQANEIKYIKDTLPANVGMVVPGTDELAMTLLARITNEQFGQWTYSGTAPKVKITYFGGGENKLADEFDYATLKQTVDYHLEMTKCNVVSSGEDLEVLVLTQGYATSHVDSLISKIKSNSNYGRLTAVIDGSNSKGPLQKKLLGLADDGYQILPELLAYSSWNTVTNSVGLCLGHAIGRACFMALGNRYEITRIATQAQVDLLFHEYAKDICYKLGASNYGRTQLSKSLGLASNSEQMDNVMSNLVKYSHTYGRNLTQEYENHVRYYFSLIDISSANYNINRLVFAFTNAYVYGFYNHRQDYNVIGVEQVLTALEGSSNRRVVFPWGRHFEALIDTTIRLS